MENNPDLQPQMPATRHNRKVMAFAVVLILLAIAGGFYFLNGPAQLENVPPTQEEATTTPLFARSAPMRLRIPKIDLETTFEAPLGLNEDKTIEVPDSYTKVGWYKNGPTPGEAGPAVILGHVDSYEGPAVFWALGKLEKGDEVEVEREDGSKAVFVITHSERFDQDEFPTQLVYGPTPEATIRLITCTGSFNKGEQRYSHNLVVFGELKDTATSSVIENIGS